MRTSAAFTFLAIVLVGSGCEIYLGGPGEKAIPDGGSDAGECVAELHAKAWPLRNPVTGACEAFGGGDPGCRGNDFAPSLPSQPLPDWPACDGTCDGLAEASCRDTAGCRAIYDSSRGEAIFTNCWPTAPSGPVNGWCGGLDALECSRHDDCIATFDGLADDGVGRFEGCDNEDPCPYLPGHNAPSAMLLRNPETGECEGWGGNHCGGTEVAVPDWAQCNGFCETLGEAICMATEECRTTFQVTDYDDSFTFGGCRGTAPSGPVRYGPCEGLDAYECSRHDNCRAVYGGFTGSFVACQDEEQICTGPAVSLRNPETGRCEEWVYSSCYDYEVPAWGLCNSSCSGLGEDACLAADGCQAITADNCPPGAMCFAYMPRFQTCWATGEVAPIPVGDCEGLDAYSCSMRDNCVAEHQLEWCNCPDMADCDCYPNWIGRFIACHAEPIGPPLPPCADTFDEAS